jgi:mRNA-degrading endonuclease RelE of RelBE toxin-antitoxin system
MRMKMTEEYDLDIKPKLQKVLKKLAKKNRKLAIAIDNKVKEICANPHRFKNLRNEMSEKNRIHFGHFVLTYVIDDEKRVVTLDDFDHHDSIYKNE